MSLDAPDLDDVTFDELREDALKRIPVLAPEWTDHNVHDPGITIIELLAWLVETYGYELDQITDRHRRKYLELAGIQPRGPRPATVALSFAVGEELNSSSANDSVLPAQTEIRAETTEGESVHFETVSDGILTPASVATVISANDRGRTDYTAANMRVDRSFPGFGQDARRGNALFLGFDVDPFASADQLELAVELADDPFVNGIDREQTGSFDPTIVIRWEHCTRPDEWYLDDAWSPVERVWDETDHLHSSGRLALRVPEDWDGKEESAQLLGSATERFWLRGRIDVRSSSSGSAAEMDGDGRSTLPPCENPADDEPSSDDDEVDRYERPPQIAWIETNVFPATQQQRDDDVTLTRVERGEPIPGFERTETIAEADQRFSFPNSPVQTAEIVVGGESWKRVDDFDASGPDDTHFVLNHVAGEIRFGDGRRGTIPPVGQEVTAQSVVYGGGPAGNVGSAARWELAEEIDAVDGVESRSTPNNGEPAETIGEAIARERDARAVPERAVTAADYRDLALRTPGVRVERAAAIADGCDGGVAPERNHVAVVVVPETPSHRRRAVPTPGVLAAVETHLCRHSLLTDRVTAVAPTYVAVSIVADVDVVDGFDRQAVREDATESLRSFLDPLSGFDGDGWPFDRPIHESELYERLESLDGIEDAIDVSVTTGEGPSLGHDKTALPYPDSITVRVREDRRRCGRGTK